MCLGVPGRVAAWINLAPTFASAQVDFGGVTRVCSMACVPDAEVGDYVVVHAGIAISRIDEAAARRAIEELASVGEASPYDSPLKPIDFEEDDAS